MTGRGAAAEDVWKVAALFCLVAASFCVLGALSFSMLGMIWLFGDISRGQVTANHVVSAVMFASWFIGPPAGWWFFARRRYREALLAAALPLLGAGGAILTVATY
jgi:hypothetical protein